MLYRCSARDGNGSQLTVALSCRLIVCGYWLQDKDDDQIENDELYNTRRKRRSSEPDVRSAEAKKEGNSQCVSVSPEHPNSKTTHKV